MNLRNPLNLQLRSTTSKDLGVGLKMYDQQKALELRNKADFHFWPLVGTANQIAGNAFFDAYDLLSEKDLLRQDIKKSANSTKEDWDRYQKTSRKELGDRWYLWQDVVNIASNNIHSDVIKLHMSIKRAMDRDRVSDTDVRSIVHLTQTLLELAVMFFDSYIGNYQSQTFLDISKDFRFARLSAMQKRWMPVTRHFSRCKGVVDLNEDSDIKLGISVIITRFSTADFINDAAGKAMHLNPQMAVYANEEDKKYFK